MRLRLPAVTFATLLILVLATGFTPLSDGPAHVPVSQDFEKLRREMVDETIRHPRDGRLPVTDPAVLRAVETVPRHLFVPTSAAAYAYLDTALSIGHEQTISQPYMVAIMTQLLEPEAGDKVLEVGTGSGYQAAVLAEIVGEVFTIEIIPELAEQARARLGKLGYRTVKIRTGDGYLGWPEEAPFDSVIVTAGATHLPRPLLEQLKPGGRMVIPVGVPPGWLTLQVVHRGRTADDLRVERVMPVAFVPLTGEHATEKKVPPQK